MLAYVAASFWILYCSWILMIILKLYLCKSVYKLWNICSALSLSVGQVASPSTAQVSLENSHLPWVKPHGKELWRKFWPKSYILMSWNNRIGANIHMMLLWNWLCGPGCCGVFRLTLWPSQRYMLSYDWVASTLDYSVMLTFAYHLQDVKTWGENKKKARDPLSIWCVQDA